MKCRRRGIVLMMVLIVVAMLALGALAFAQLMISEHRAAATSTRQTQSRSFADTGAAMAMKFLDRYPADLQTAGGLYDNPAPFKSQLVSEDDSPRERGKFSIIAPKLDDSTANTIVDVRYGLLDESTKINLACLLNYDPSGGSAGSGSGGTASAGGGGGGSGGGASTASEVPADVDDADDDEITTSTAHAILMALPGMTQAIADSILDWMDPDDDPREQGAESDYYSALQPPYVPRNAPPASIEELLLVQGVTPELLFGLDAVKMGYSTSDAVASAIGGFTDGSMDHGWAAYLTLWSAESTLKTSDGTPKINVNQDDMSTLYSQLCAVMDPKWAQYIVFYRQGGGTVDASGNADTSAFGTGRNTIGSMLDVVGATVRVVPSTSGSTTSGASTGGSASSGATVLPSPFTTDTQSMSTYLPQLFDACTTVAGTSIPGRININQASGIVLMSIPGMTQDIVNGIIANRQPDPASAAAQALPTHTCPAWPLIEGLATLTQMKQMIPYITAGGSVYSAHIIGHFDKGNPVARVEVIIDATQHPARVLFWKDMSHSTGGFPGETSGLIGSLTGSQSGSQGGSQTGGQSDTQTTNPSTPGAH